MIDDLKPSGQMFWLLGLCTLATAVLGSLPELGLPTWGTALAGAVLTAVVAWLTPFTRQFGVGSDRKDPRVQDETADQ